MKNMVVLVGLPGAGKTTIATRLFSSHRLISFDVLPNRTRNEEDKAIIRSCRIGEDVVIDAANIDARKRRRYIRLAREYGYLVHALFIDSSLDEAISRNSHRDRHVPDGVIRSYCEKLEMPSRAEGLDSVFIVWNNWLPEDK